MDPRGIREMITGILVKMKDGTRHEIDPFIGMQCDGNTTPVISIWNGYHYYEYQLSNVETISFYFL